MTNALLSWLLPRLLDVTRDQWTIVFRLVCLAAEQFVEAHGHVKNRWVREKIANRWPDMKPHVVDALVGAAVAWAKKLNKA